MTQKEIRDWGGVPYTNAEAEELTQELNDRTASSQAGYNSVDELATKVKSAETNITAKEDKISKGVANGYAELGADGKVPAAQLPAGTDEVQEYANLAAFPATGSSSVIYVALDTNTTYRWGGTVYVEISSSLALGETSTTAYRGDRGKIAYDHSQTAHAPSDAEANQPISEIKTELFALADTNNFDDAKQTKLAQIEDSATADQTGAEIKSLYEAEDNTNAYTDAEKAQVATNTSDISSNHDDIVDNAGAILLIQGEQTTQDAAIALNTAKPNSPTESTGVALVLSDPIGRPYNMGAANGGLTYTTSGLTPMGFAICRINTATEPTVTGATKISGATWVASTDMHMVVQTLDGTVVQYYFIAL